MPNKDCKFCGLCLKIFPALNLENQNHMERWVSNSQENMITATQRGEKKQVKICHIYSFHTQNPIQPCSLQIYTAWGEVTPLIMYNLKGCTSLANELLLLIY